MEIVRTYESGGELWGETAEGENLKWEVRSGRWTKTAPAVGAEAGHDGSEPAGKRLATEVDLVRAGEFPIDEAGAGPLDEVWVRKFPPFSAARLLLGIALLPFVGLMSAAWRMFRYGEDFSWTTYVFTVLMGSLLLTVVFVYQWWKKDRIRKRRPWTLSPENEIALSTVFFFVGIAGSTALIDPRTLQPLLLLTLLLVSALSSVLLHFRMWMAIAALLSAGAGFVGAIFLTMFGTFMGGEQNFFLNWLLASGFVFLFVAPFAWGIKKHAERFERRDRIPTWIIAGLAGMFMLSSTGFFVVFEGVELPVDVPASELPPHLRSSAMSPRIATQLLYQAWQTNSRLDAEKVASPGIVDRLFSEPFRNQPYRGCGYLGANPAEYRCVVQTETDLMLFEALHTDGGFYIGGLERAPVGTIVEGVPTGASAPAPAIRTG